MGLRKCLVEVVLRRKSGIDQVRERCNFTTVFITRVKEEKLDKDEIKARKCGINSRTPTWISSDTKRSVN